LNEPNLGYRPINLEADKLAKFYRKATNAIRAAEQESKAFRHIIFFEMSVTWNGQPIPFVPSVDLITDENTILDLLYGLSGAYKTGTFIGEFGFFGNPVDDVEKYKRFAKKEDANFSSSTWWQWAQAPGDPHGISWDGMQYDNTSTHLLEVDKNGNFTGVKNEYYLNVLNRSRPNAIFGKPVKLVSSPDNGTMELQAKSTSQGVTTIWIPDRFGEPHIAGTNILSTVVTKVEGGYIANVTVSGNYMLNVSF
jgi:endoglycosylceramidase